MKKALKILSFIICLQLYSWSAIAQIGLNNAESTRSLSLGGSSLLFQNIDAAFSNQAGLADVKGVQAIAFVEQRFDLAELSTASFAVAKNFNFGTAAINLSSFGFSDYSNQKLGLAYARKLFDNLAISGQFDLFNTQIKGYGSTQYITFEVGVYSKLTNQIHIAAHIFSPGNVGITDNDELSSRIRIGAKYIASKKVNISAEFHKVIAAQDDIRVGIEYMVIDKLILRVGTSFDPSKYSFGFAYQLPKGIYIEGGYSYHQQLGNTPGIGVKYQPSSSKTKADSKNRKRK